MDLIVKFCFSFTLKKYREKHCSYYPSYPLFKVDTKKFIKSKCFDEEKNYESLSLVYNTCIQYAHTNIQFSNRQFQSLMKL